MTDSGKSLRLATGMAAGVNVVLFFLVAWALAVDRGLNPQRELARFLALPQDSAPEEVLIVMAAEPEPEDSTGKEQKDLQYVSAPDDVPEQTPTRDTNLISSKSMRAASEQPPDPNGKAGEITQSGRDIVSLDLRDERARSGDTAAAATGSEASAPPESPAAPLAFRDATGENIIPLEVSPLSPQPAAAPARVSTVKAKSEGDIQERGLAARDTRAGAIGKFNKTQKSLFDARFEENRRGVKGYVGNGLVEVEYDIDLQGRISNVRIANPEEANSIFQDLALTAVLTSKCPPLSPELIRELGDAIVDGKVRRTYGFFRF